MEHRDWSLPPFQDAKVARFALNAFSSLLYRGGRGLKVPFFSVQDCRLVFQPFCKRISKHTPQLPKRLEVEPRSMGARENYSLFLSVLYIIHLSAAIPGGYPGEPLGICIKPFANSTCLKGQYSSTKSYHCLSPGIIWKDSKIVT